MPYSDPEKQKEAMRNYINKKRQTERNKEALVNKSISAVVKQTGILQEVKAAFERTKREGWSTFKQDPLSVLSYSIISNLHNKLPEVIRCYSFEAELNKVKLQAVPKDVADKLIKGLTLLIFNFNQLPSYKNRLETIKAITQTNASIGIPTREEKPIWFIHPADKALADWLAVLVDAFNGVKSFEDVKPFESVAIVEVNKMYEQLKRSVKKNE